MNDTISGEDEYLELPAPREAALSDAGGLCGHRVLVTGATGFIGRHLMHRLRKEGAEVHALTRPDGSPRPDVAGTTWHHVDLEDREALTSAVQRIAPSVMFHLASRVEGRRDKTLALPMLEANTRVAVALMTAALDLPECRVVLAGSIEEPRGEEPPVSPYAAAKGATTGYARLFHAQWGLPVTVLRIAMVYGPNQPDERKLVPYVCQCLADGGAPSLSSGTRPVDWVYIADVCDALYRAATSRDAPGRVLDIGSGQTATVAEVVTELADIAGYRGILGFGDVADRRDDRAHIADTEPAARHLDWRAETPLHTGLEWTLAWYRLQRQGPDHAAGDLGLAVAAQANSNI